MLRPNARQYSSLKNSSGRPVTGASGPSPSISNLGRGKRARGQHNIRLPYTPPEQWYEPSEGQKPYRIIVRQPGSGYRHIVTPEDVRRRLAQLPSDFLRPLQIVHFAQMTHKKRSAPCYGMQWGSTIYLYPIEMDLIEHYDQPPKPAQLIEARMFGGRWERESDTAWKLIWAEESIRDFYLNNILIHELGHILDDRNSRTIDRERYAEWFAVQYGYRPTQKQRAQRQQSSR